MQINEFIIYVYNMSTQTESFVNFPAHLILLLYRSQHITLKT